jgi:hypothetical protein
VASQALAAGCELRDGGGAMVLSQAQKIIGIATGVRVQLDS